MEIPKVNEELLKCIESVQFQTLGFERIPFSEVMTLDDKTRVHMVLNCKETAKFKLMKQHYAYLEAKEARIYIQLGIPEYTEEV